MSARSWAMAGWVALASLGCGGSTVIDASGAGGSADAVNTSSSSATQAGVGGQSNVTVGVGVGGASQGGASPGPWRAEIWSGQIDHLSIRHLDTAADVCILVTASAPGGGGNYDVTIPSPWGVGAISAWDDTAGCMDPQFTPSGLSEQAEAATGSIDFDVAPMQYYPCELDVDVVATFDSPPSWLPANLTLKTSMLTVDGACP